jgi:predicted HicB family RNase H-like nuclease
MSITKKPKRPTSDIEQSTNDSVRTEGTKVDETKAEAFIAGASEPSLKAHTAKIQKAERQPILIRFDPALLRKVEEAAQRRGISRSAWIQYVLSVALEKGEG